MENKVLVNLYIPFLEKKYELFLPVNKTIGEIILMLAKALPEVTNGYYEYKGEERLYNRINGAEYNINELLKYTNIRNGTELIFM
ncbi:MAG: hypothetical protein MR598_03835 [Erysipelotrichaceae bacterium]|nr:hypothetical protein [Erysipelotrichaceae bacterium]